jgi:uncharacterized membrane protein YuzA (DUF378 family)
MRTATLVTLILLIVGGLNWLLVGVFQFDLVAALFGGQTAPISRLVYVIVGLCAIWQLIKIPSLYEDRTTATTTTTGTTTRPTDRV